jgi:hypothetical protein
MDQQEFNRLVDGELAELYQAYSTGESGPELKRSFINGLATGLACSDSLFDSQSTIIVTSRNQAARKVLRREFKPKKKRLAILYGGAHMPDFEIHLAKDFGVRQLEERWLVACDMRTPPRQRVCENGTHRTA